MAHKSNPLMARFQDQPALIEEGRSAWLESCLQAVAEKAAEFEKLDSENGDFWFSPDDYRSNYRPYKVKDGILHIPVKGVLMNNFPYAYGSWATGYEYIWQAAKRGADDSNVKAIAFIIDSGGGMVAGNFDLNDRLYNLRGRKPMRAYADEHAYSAAYSIASCADTLTVARTGGVGSIGVVVVHMEMSKMLEERGIQTTIIRSKPGKMEGNAYEALSEGARERMQQRVDEFHNQFVALVARNRGMSVKAVDETNALTFMPQQAIDNGLADEIGNLDDAITAFVATINSEGDEEMADFTQAQHDEAVAKAVADATATAKAEGVTEERGRISAIVNSDEGKKRPLAAVQMATDEDLVSLKPDAVAKILAKMPEESGKAETPKTTGTTPADLLKAAMKGEGAAGVEADGGEEKNDAPEDARAKRARAMVNL